MTAASPAVTELLLEQARDAAEIERDRADAAEARVAEYENAVTWSTTCTSCATVLDSCITETERRARAEDAFAAERERADEAKAQLAGLEGRIGAVIGATVMAEQERARAADAKVERARELAGSWTADDGHGVPTPEMLTEAACGKALLDVLGGDGSGS